MRTCVLVAAAAPRRLLPRLLLLAGCCCRRVLQLGDTPPQRAHVQCRVGERALHRVHVCVRVGQLQQRVVPGGRAAGQQQGRAGRGGAALAPTHGGVQHSRPHSRTFATARRLAWPAAAARAHARLRGRTAAAACSATPAAAPPPAARTGATPGKDSRRLRAMSRIACCILDAMCGSAAPPGITSRCCACCAVLLLSSCALMTASASAESASLCKRMRAGGSAELSGRTACACGPSTPERVPGLVERSLGLCCCQTRCQQLRARLDGLQRGDQQRKAAAAQGLRAVQQQRRQRARGHGAAMSCLLLGILRGF